MRNSQKTRCSAHTANPAPRFCQVLLALGSSPCWPLRGRTPSVADDRHPIQTSFKRNSRDASFFTDQVMLLDFSAVFICTCSFFSQVGSIAARCLRLTIYPLRDLSRLGRECEVRSGSRAHPWSQGWMRLAPPKLQGMGFPQER